jgi:glycosyltransferase involved in cell wall biosynthesis
MEPRLNIAHVITRYIQGGADENTLNSCNAFAQRGHAVTLIYGREASEKMVAKLHPSIKAIQIPALQRAISPIADARALLALRRELRSLKPDIVHTHTSKAGVLGRAAAIGLGTATVHGLHILPFENAGTAARLIYLALERSLVRATDCYVSVSEGVRNTAMAHRVGSARQHHVVPSSMELEQFKNAASSRAADRGRRRVLYLANYEPRKQHRQLVQAIAAKRDMFADTTFVLAGQGYQEHALRSLVNDLGVRNTVDVLGFAEDAGSLIASADLALYCSCREGLPRAVVQYCAAGRPVVALHLPGIEAVIRDGENGKLCQQGDFDSLLEQVRELLDDDALRARMASAATRMNLDAWSADHAYDCLYKIYVKALQPSGARGVEEAAPVQPHLSAQASRPASEPAQQDSVAVVMTCFNEGPWLEQSVRSVLEQTAADRIAEIVILDDGSEQATLDVLTRVASWDRRIRLLYQSGRGVAGNRNRGVRATRSPILALLDSDDYWEPPKLEIQLAQLAADPSCGLVYTGFRLFADQRPETARDVRVADLSSSTDTTLSYFTHDPPIVPSTVLFRRTAFEAVDGFDENVKVFEDTDFFLRLSRVTRFAGAPSVLIQKRLHKGSLTSRRQKLMTHHALVAFRFAEREPRFLPYIPRRLAERARKLANIEALDGRRQSAESLYRLAVSLRPTDPRTWSAMIAHAVGGQRLMRGLSQLKLSRTVR